MIYDFFRISGDNEAMVRRRLEQKKKDSHFKQRHRDEDKSAAGALAKGKAQGKGRNKST